MKSKKRLQRLVLATVVPAAIVLACTRGARAQYRVDNSGGHALDASNRIGSGGYNGAPSNINNVNASQIFLGNVTGFGAFQGGSPRDPRQFQGYQPASPGLQLQREAGITSYAAPPTYNQAQPFYSYRTATNAPAGFTGAVGGVYQPAPPLVRQPQDYRLGNILDNNPSSALPAAGQVIGAGAIDPRASMTPSFLLNTSPLYGQRELNLDNSYAGGSSSGGTLSPRLSVEDIVKLRSELGQSPTPWQTPGSVGVAGAQPGQIGQTAAPLAPGAAGAIPNYGQSATPQPLGATSLSKAAALPTGAVAENAGAFGTGQSRRQYLAPLPAPAEQSVQYSKLRQLLDQYQASHPQNDEEASRQFQAALRARRQYEQSLGKPAAPSSKPPVSSLPDSSIPVQPSVSERPDVQSPAPLEVGSIGQGIRASGLGQLVKEGEELSRHQQFKDAIAKFLDAQQVAPNNMLITVDLANAELGGGFYNQAEQYLRQAFASDPAMLMAKYDVKSMIGDERLQASVADLKRIASSGDSSTPVFLLAYLSFNQGESAKAVEYLKLAQSRAGGQDEVIQSLSAHWSLSAKK